MSNIPSTYFKREEFECNCGCGFDAVDAELLAVLTDLREHFDRAVHLNSACRCVDHNRAVGGGEDSQHLLGKAADVWVFGVIPELVHEYLCEKYNDRYGIGSYTSFTHIDVRTKKARF